VTIAQGASGASTITLTRSGGFAAAVALTATGLPAGVTATFSPASATGPSSTLTLAAAATATTGGPASITVTGTSGALARTTTISVTVTPATGNTGGVTVTPVVNATGQWFNDIAVRLANTAPLTALSVTITIQRTTGVSFSGQYNTIGGQILQSNSSTATAITYQYSLSSGQTVAAGTNRMFAAQAGGNGTVHPTAGDTFTVTYTSGGTTFTQTGHF
jgi:hypothetical protein